MTITTRVFHCPASSSSASSSSSTSSYPFIFHPHLTSWHLQSISDLKKEQEDSDDECTFLSSNKKGNLKKCTFLSSSKKGDSKKEQEDSDDKCAFLSSSKKGDSKRTICIDDNDDKDESILGPYTQSQKASVKDNLKIVKEESGEEKKSFKIKGLKPQSKRQHSSRRLPWHDQC
ncbi:hypothetical protein H9Q69_007165 [Fusarium xylarioides]|nr:hypothetical protein H9Q69_007165 [Fusarium xylarioides]